MSNPQQLVELLWNYYNVFWDDGLCYGNYVEQLSFLLFLAIAFVFPAYIRTTVKVEHRLRVMDKLEVMMSADLQRVTRLANPFAEGIYGKSLILQ